MGEVLAALKSQLIVGCPDPSLRTTKTGHQRKGVGLSTRPGNSAEMQISPANGTNPAFIPPGTGQNFLPLKQLQFPRTPLSRL